MVGLTTQNFVSAATGIACSGADPSLLAQLGTDRRKFLCRSDALRCSMSCCLSRSSPRCFSSGRAYHRTSATYVDATTLEGAKQTLAKDRRRRRSRSSNSAPMAAASSMSIRPSRRKSYTAVQFPAGAVHPADPCGADPYLRPHGGRRTPGLGALCRDVDRVPRWPHNRLLGGRLGQSELCRAWPRSRATWKARRSASASPIQPMGGRNYGGVERLRQFDA